MRDDILLREDSSFKLVQVLKEPWETPSRIWVTTPWNHRMNSVLKYPQDFTAQPLILYRFRKNWYERKSPSKIHF